VELTTAEFRAVTAGAKRAAKAGRDLLPLDDLKQEVLVWLYERPALVERWREENTSARKIRTVSYRVGVEAVRREQRQTGQPKRRDQWQADVGLLEEVLPEAVAGPEAWIGANQTPPDEVKRGTSTPAEGNNYLALMCDVSRAFDGLNDEQKFVLQALVIGEYTQQDLADNMELDRNAVRRIKKRALNDMLDSLGGLGWSHKGQNHA